MHLHFELSDLGLYKNEHTDSVLPILLRLTQLAHHQAIKDPRHSNARNSRIPSALNKPVCHPHDCSTSAEANVGHGVLQERFKTTCRVDFLLNDAPSQNGPTHAHSRPFWFPPSSP